MKLYKKLILAGVLLISSISASAVVTTYDNGQRIYVYSSYPLPGRTNDTVIALMDYGFGSYTYVLSPPNYFYGTGVNADIMWCYDYALSHNLPFRWGYCKTVNYSLTCLN